MIVIKGKNGKSRIVETLYTSGSHNVCFSTEFVSGWKPGYYIVNENCTVSEIKSAIQEFLLKVDTDHIDYFILYTNFDGAKANSMEAVMNDIEEQTGRLVKFFVMTRQ